MMNPFNLISSSKGDKGMSLMEVMIAVTLLAFVMIGIITVTENSMNAKDRTIQVNKDNLAIENAISRLEWDLSQLYSPLYFSTITQKVLDPSVNQCTNCQDLFQYYENNPRFKSPSVDGLPIPIYNSKDKTEFIFLTSSNRKKIVKAKQSYYSWIQYSLGEDRVYPDDDSTETKTPKTSKALIRKVINEDIFKNDSLDFENTRPMYLLSNVETLEFSFWNHQTRKYESSLTTIPLGQHLLRGIKVDISWLDSNGNKRSTSRLFRPLWTFFDAQALAQANNQNNTNLNSNNNTTTPGANENTSTEEKE